MHGQIVQAQLHGGGDDAVPIDELRAALTRRGGRLLPGPHRGTATGHGHGRDAADERL